MKNREIKFRAWFRDEHSSKAEMHYDVRDFKDNPDQYHYYRVMQYTGLLDKNGKEIYEGDIIGKKNPDWLNGFSGKWQVEFGETTQDEYGSEVIGYRTLNADEEIIGNIYENHET